MTGMDPLKKRLIKYGARNMRVKEHKRVLPWFALYGLVFYWPEKDNDFLIAQVFLSREEGEQFIAEVEAEMS